MRSEKNLNNNLLKKWWFWTIIAVSIIVIILLPTIAVIAVTINLGFHLK